MGGFFNIFQKDQVIHLMPTQSHDKSLIYMHFVLCTLDVGDQNCGHPGILKIYDPEFDLLPKKGMIVIMPATQKHSSIYGGKRDRLMVGANFYAFSPLPMGSFAN